MSFAGASQPASCHLARRGGAPRLPCLGSCFTPPCPALPVYPASTRLEVPAAEEGEPEFAAMLFYDEITRGDAFMCECAA